MTDPDPSENPFRTPGATTKTKSAVRPNFADWLVALLLGFIAFAFMMPVSCIGATLIGLDSKLIPGNLGGYILIGSFSIIFSLAVGYLLASSHLQHVYRLHANRQKAESREKAE